tara:strand:- start:372 stop:779 length:408 start_codon:yes stop_codon:yes gene_type:complete
MNTIVVTRHPSLVQHLVELGRITPETPVIAHATEADVAGRHVIGVLPLRLAAHAASVTEVALNVPPELRGKELTLDDVRRYACATNTYTVSLTEGRGSMNMADVRSKLAADAELAAFASLPDSSLAVLQQAFRAS